VEERLCARYLAGLAVSPETGIVEAAGTCDVEGTVGLEATSNANGGSQFRIASEQDGGTSYLRLEGEFDLACKEMFQEHLLGVTADRPAGVIVDLSRLEFMDSSGLRMLAEAESLCRESGIDYGVIAGTGQARRVFDLTGMDDVLPVVD
jgi:anti-anti-sigma factor